VQQHPQILDYAHSRLDSCDEAPTATGTNSILSAIEDAIYDLFKHPNSDKFDVAKFLQALIQTGIMPTDPRLKHFYTELVRRGLAHDGDGKRQGDCTQVYMRCAAIYDATQTMCFPSSLTSHSVLECFDGELDKETFKECIRHSIVLVTKALQNQLVIPDWKAFVDQVTDVVKEAQKGKESYIGVHTNCSQRRPRGHVHSATGARQPRPVWRGRVHCERTAARLGTFQGAVLHPIRNAPLTLSISQSGCRCRSRSVTPSP
jgi:hypothetical protein